MTTIRWRLLSPLLALMITAAACGGGGSDDNNGFVVPIDATPTPDTFDNQALTTLVLTSEDVGGLPSLSTVDPSADFDLTYGATFGDNSYQVQSSAGRYADPVEREINFDHLRRAIANISRNERNYDLPGADLAFAYISSSHPSQVPTSAILAFRGPFFLLVSISSPDGTRRDDAYDEATLDRYARIMISRLDALLATTAPAPDATPAALATPTP